MGSISIGQIGGLDYGLQHHPTGINEQIALETVQILGSIVAAWPPLSVALAL